jgi:hypothetical protein
MYVPVVSLLLGVVLMSPGAPTVPSGMLISPDVIDPTVAALVETHGESEAARIRQGVTQVAERWWPEDGDTEAFRKFCETGFISDLARLDETFGRLEAVIEQIDGHLHEVRRELTTPIDLDTGPVMTLDRLLANLDLSAHVNEDLFATKVAFLALLNFPVHTLGERLTDGPSWDRETWARSRMMDRFAQRVPSDVAMQMSLAFRAASNYIDEYNVRMDRLVTPEGERPFPEGLRLISHWGLRDELSSHYGEPEGLAKQRMIEKVMYRIVRQEIPEIAIDNADVIWSPETNEVWSWPDREPVASEREPDTRYARLLDVFDSVRAADPYSPTAPDYVTRRFELGRQIPEKEVETLLLSVVDSDEVKALAKIIEKRLGRPLEPFDIWYSGFDSRGERSEAELDEIVSKRYPTRESFQADLPRILEDLGFGKEKAAWLADHIVVDPSRGAGHASGAVRREDKAHLRTRIAEGGMNYKGYNIAVHELGHNVEQVFSLNGIDHWWLNGVPNTAFTEALAFVFQARDLELLGLESAGDEARATEALSTLWGAYEIGGVALVDMKVWNWMYANPDATPAELRDAALAAAREVWNKYYAPIFGVKDCEILAIYSHMIAYGLYLPDYPMGHIIAFQIADKLRKGDFGAEFERVSRQGLLTPDAWMRGAVGNPISTGALLSEAREAMKILK